MRLPGPGRIRLAAIDDFSAASLHRFMAANMVPGSTAKTDGWPAYPGAPEVSHQPHVIGAMAAHLVLPWIHRVFSTQNLGARRLSRPAGKAPPSLSRRVRLFRFNRRRTRHAAFRSLLVIASTAPAPLTYKMLITPEPKG